MLVADVFLNGKRIGGTDYGYVGFELDVTKELKDGDNTLVVAAYTQDEKASRWYTGGGLFRNVSMVTTANDLYLERHPLYITTRQNRYANVGVEMTFAGRAKTAKLQLKVFAPDGTQVCETTQNVKRQTASRTEEFQLPEVEISSPQLWDTEHPNLYRAEVTLLTVEVEL